MNLKYILSGYKSHISCLIRNKISKNQYLKDNIMYKNLHVGERCFILGSGHSILTQDLTKLQGEIVITQNHFHVHPDIAVIQPKYHVVVPKYQPAEYDPNWVEWFESMENTLPEKTKYFMGLNSKELIEENKLFLNKVNYMLTGLNPMFMKKAVVDITHDCMSIPTVITQCLTIALYMGFNKIYLLGFDLDQPCRMEDRDKVRFYGNSPVTDTEAEKRTEQHQTSSGVGWFNRWLMWKQFILLRDEAERNGGEIINLAPGGLLDCYKRQSYDQVI